MRKGGTAGERNDNLSSRVQRDAKILKALSLEIREKLLIYQNLYNIYCAVKDRVIIVILPRFLLYLCWFKDVTLILAEKRLKAIQSCSHTYSRLCTRKGMYVYGRAYHQTLCTFSLIKYSDQTSISKTESFAHECTVIFVL